MRDYTDISFWLAECGDDLRPRPPLEGSHRADVAILGAGCYDGFSYHYHLPVLASVVLSSV